MTPTLPVAITGMHRSGTSMITRALHDSGLHLVGTGADELIEAAEDNPEGFWENKAIRDCNDELLEATGGAWDNPPALPPVAVDDPRVAHVADAATAALATLRRHDHWGFKDPRTCLTAAYWLDLEPELRFVICVRHPIEVALSIKRRNQNSYSLGLGLWERYYATVLDQVPPEHRIVTHYDTFFVDPEGEMARLCAFSGLEPVAPPVRSDLRHHTTGMDLGDAGVSDGVRTLYADLCREAGAPPPRLAPLDEGRVRRLILDGAVAQRYADQRQAAIERLQEREEELRAAHVKAEQAHRDRVRDLEAKVGAARLAALEGETARAIAGLRESVVRIDERTRRVEARSFPGIVGRAARAAARRLPPPAQQSLRRGWRLAQR
ncbi:MAG: sulfotransferase family protein, partial [Acidimicrobiales bacterium]